MRKEERVKKCRRKTECTVDDILYRIVLVLGIIGFLLIIAEFGILVAVLVG